MSDVSVKVSASTEGLSSGLAKAKEAVSEFKEQSKDSLKELAGEWGKVFALGAIVEGLHSVMEEMDRVQKLGIRFGESAESIQRVGQAAKLSGSDMESVSKAMAKVNNNALDAIKGSDELSGSFATLGIDAAGFVDLPMEEKLLKLSDGYAQGQGNAEKMAAVMKLLGKGSADLIPLLAQGSDALKETFDNATVASQETVDAIAETSEKVEHFVDTLKAWAADGIGFVIHAVEGLGAAAAIVTAYVSNLGHGFSAAKDAASEALQAYQDLRAEEAEERQEKREKGKNEGTAERIEKSKEAGEAETELEKLREEHAKKAEEARLKSLSLATREYELRKEIGRLEADAEIARVEKDEKGQLEAENKLFDLRKELDKNQDEQKKADDKSKSDLDKANERAAKETLKAQEQSKKDELKNAESKLSELEKDKSHYSVDSLRSIGGGIAGAQYNRNASKEELQKQAVQYQKQTVEELKKAVQALENKVRTMGSGDGSFAL